jgi:hypothetical protein
MRQRLKCHHRRQIDDATTPARRHYLKSGMRQFENRLNVDSDRPDLAIYERFHEVRTAGDARVVYQQFDLPQLLHTLRHRLDPFAGRQIRSQRLDVTACCGGLLCKLLQAINATSDRDYRPSASREHTRKLQADA